MNLLDPRLATLAAAHHQAAALLAQRRLDTMDTDDLRRLIDAFRVVLVEVERVIADPDCQDLAAEAQTVRSAVSPALDVAMAVLSRAMGRAPN